MHRMFITLHGVTCELQFTVAAVCYLSVCLSDPWLLHIKTTCSQPEITIVVNGSDGASQLAQGATGPVGLRCRAEGIQRRCLTLRYCDTHPPTPLSAIPIHPPACLPLSVLFRPSYITLTLPHPQNTAPLFLNWHIRHCGQASSVISSR